MFLHRVFTLRTVFPLLLVALSSSLVLGSLSVYAETTSAHRIRTLVASCYACHGPNGNSLQGTPSLAGLNARHFIQQMHQFKSGARLSTVMHHHAKGLTDSEIEMLATYFSELNRNAPAKLPYQPFKGAQ